MSLEIVNGGALTTVQDLGRFGYMNKGFQVSGAVDDQAMRLANILVGNDQKEAVLEATIMGTFDPVYCSGSDRHGGCQHDTETEWYSDAIV